MENSTIEFDAQPDNWFNNHVFSLPDISSLHLNYLMSQL